eukprot:5887046-Pyramimonas_sp.AAC.2
MFVADATAFASAFFKLSGRTRPGDLATSKESDASEPLGMKAMSAQLKPRGAPPPAKRRSIREWRTSESR